MPWDMGKRAFSVAMIGTRAGTNAAMHKIVFLLIPGVHVAMIPTRRDLKFRLPIEAASHWHDRGAVLTHFINAMSLTFPEGERYFIHTLRHYRSRIEDPVLKEAVTAFIGQEALHGREHAEYNALLAEVGLPAKELEGEVTTFFNLLKAWLPPAAQLSITIAQEHFTAIIAEAMLEDPDLIAGADPRLTALWRWHALEEIEHKAVAFDVFETAVGRSIPAYALRSASMVTTTTGFLLLVLWCQGRMMLADRRPGARRGFVPFLSVLLSPRNGLVRRLAKPWLSYFKPGFHPWDHDNAGLLHEVEQLVAGLGSPTSQETLARTPSEASGERMSRTSRL